MMKLVIKVSKLHSFFQFGDFFLNDILVGEENRGKLYS